METLDNQIALVRYYSLREFKDRISQGKLKVKAQFELIMLRDTAKFECYVNMYQLDPEAERKLVESGRRDLFEIYFPLYRCCSYVEALLVRYPKTLSIYAKYHELSKNSQKVLVRNKKAKNTLKYAKKRDLCEEARSFFRGHAEKALVLAFDRMCGT